MFTPNEYEEPPEEEPEVIKALTNPSELKVEIRNFTEKEVVTIIKKINPNKAPGYDLITGRILNYHNRTGIKYLTKLYNATLKLRFFPLQWKTAQTTMILKPGKDAENPKSYRPISLLTIASKVLELNDSPQINACNREKEVDPRPSIWLSLQTRHNRPNP